MFTDNHRRYLSTLLRHIEREVEESIAPLRGEDRNALFHHYRNFPTPERMGALEAHLARLRAVIRRFMDTYRIDYRSDDLIEASWGFETHLALIRNAVYELRPRNLRGYGEMSAEEEQICRALSAELVMVLNTMAGELRRAPLPRLEGSEDALLATVVDIVERHRLFEYRPRVEALVDREQGDRLEVALLGRVSSGKSSLVNALLEHPLLPVGAVPVTTVVTRIRFGGDVDIRAVDAEGQSHSIAPEELGQYVDEAGNSGNWRRLREVDVHFPASILDGGIVLADTPGLGSLHVHASAHALDYLPRCDLGLVAIDASATLTPQDADIVRALRDADAQWLIVLTKADTVSADALEQQRRYVSKALTEALGTPVDVSAVSIRPEHRIALDAWRKGALQKKLTEAMDLAAARHRARAIELAKRVQVTLHQAQSELPAPSSTPATPRADVLAQLEDASPRLHTLVRQMAERGAMVIVEDIVTQSPGHRILRAEDVSARAGELADAVVRDVLKELRRTAQGTDMDGINQSLRGVPPFSAGLPDSMQIQTGSGLAFFRRLLLRRRLKDQLESLLKQSFETYADELNHWLDDTLRQLRRRAMETTDPMPLDGQVDASVLMADIGRLHALLGESRPGSQATSAPTSVG